MTMRRLSEIKCYLVILFMVFYIQLAWTRDSRTIIRVNNQEEFDNLNSLIKQSLNSDVQVLEIWLSPGVYKFHNEHISIMGTQNSDLSLRMKGENAIVMADGADMVSGRCVRYVNGAGYVSSDFSDVENYSKMYQMESLVEVVDADKKICRVSCPDPALNTVNDWSCGRIELTAWYTSFSYAISDISDGYIYFRADNLERGLSHYGNYNINYDYTVGHIYPRFRLVNLPIGGCDIASNNDSVRFEKQDMVHQCVASRFLTISKSSFKSISISDLRFVGNSSHSKALIYFSNVNAQDIKLSKNEFSSLRSVAISVNATNNVSVERCAFHDNYASVVSIANSSDNATICNNRFYNNGKSLKQSFCILCRGGSYTISRNEISDFNYSAIGVGVWYKEKTNTRACYGVVEKNHIYYTEEFYKNRSDWTLIDSGAIYVWTKNTGTVIRDNFIHDYAGMGSNRGIYCDDGVNNCSIYNNIVLNIGNSYSIDLRRAAHLEKEAIGSRSNENNRIYGNVINNRLRFEGRNDASTSIKGKNTILSNSLDSLPAIIIKNVVMEEDDTVDQYREKKWYRLGKRLVR